MCVCYIARLLVPLERVLRLAFGKNVAGALLRFSQSSPPPIRPTSRGSVRCDAVGEGLSTAVALEMDPGTRIFTTLPVVPVPEMPSRE